VSRIDLAVPRKNDHVISADNKLGFAPARIKPLLPGAHRPGAKLVLRACSPAQMVFVCISWKGSEPHK
jgi:hypothetical protein